MTVLRFRFGLHLAVAAAVAVSLAALTPTPLSAQTGGMGGGGMGGGIGGRGDGMGGRGGGMGGGSMMSPAAMARERLEKADPIEYLLDRKKLLELSREQQDTFKSLRKEMQRAQEPLFKDLDKLFGDMPQRGGRGGGGPPDGGMAGGLGGGAPDAVRVVIGKISDMQDSFRDRAREQLNPVQQTCADSLQLVILEEERARFEKEREKRREQRGRANRPLLVEAPASEPSFGVR